MLTMPPNVRIFLALQPVDMRRSFDGLAGQVKHTLRLDPLSGHLYVFLNRRRTLMKILFFDRTGYCILYKRLEQGTFQLPEADPETGRVELAPADLALILEGIDLRHIKRRKRYQHPKAAA